MCSGRAFNKVCLRKLGYSFILFFISIVLIFHELQFENDIDFRTNKSFCLFCFKSKKITLKGNVISSFWPYYLMCSISLFFWKRMIQLVSQNFVEMNLSFNCAKSTPCVLDPSSERVLSLIKIGASYRIFFTHTHYFVRYINPKHILVLRNFLNE